MRLQHLKWAVLGIAGAVLIVAFLGFCYSSTRGVQQNLAAIRAAGLPASPAELDAWYRPVPVRSNQALVIMEAAKFRVDRLRNADPDSKRLGSLEVSSPLLPEIANAIETLLATNRPALELIHEAAQMTESRYPIDLSQGAGTTLPHLAHIRGFVQLLRLEAVQYSQAGKSAEAVRSLTAALAIAASLRNEPIYISERVRMGCVAIALGGLEHLLSEHQLTRKQLDELSRCLSDAETMGKAGLTRSLIGERAMGVSIFQLSQHDLDRLSALPILTESDGIFQTLAFQAYRASGTQQRDLSLYLAMMGKLIGPSTSEFPEALERAEQWELELSERLASGFSRFAILSRTLLIPLGKAVFNSANLT